MIRPRYRRDAEHFVTVTGFEWQGRRYEPGDDFPALALGLSELRRCELWVANKIEVDDRPRPLPPPSPPSKHRPRAGA